MVRNTDRDWRTLGEADPYWGVISHERYRRGNLTEEALDEFYETGVGYVDSIFEIIRSRLDRGFKPARALDFGCGVGRVIIPLARHCEEVVGVDVSPGMVAAAQARCASLGVANVRFETGDAALGHVSGTFDLIHTFIVLQHIPSQRGMQLVRRLIEMLAEGGVCVLHVGYGERRAHPGANDPLARRIRHRTRELLRRVAGPLASRLRPRVDRSGPAPIHSYEYDLNALFEMVQEAGIRRMHVEYTDHAGLYGVILFFQHVRDDTYLA